MKEEEARLEAEVKALLEKAEVADEEEDRQYGKDKRGDELPEELAFKESRLKKIRQARKALEAEAKLARKTGKKTTGIPDDKAQRNFTDPESKIMPAPGGKHFEQAYNAQAAVDSANQIIVAADLINEPNDKKQAIPMMKQLKTNTGKLPKEMSADTGYFSSDVVSILPLMALTSIFLQIGCTAHKSDAGAPRGRIPKGLSILDGMRRKLRTKRGREHYGLRKEVSEPVFGQIQQARGFRQFSFRGKQKVKGEWRFICTGHNILKLFAAWRDGLLGQSGWSGQPQLVVT